MSTITNDYSRFYRGMESLQNYGSNRALKKDTLVRYEFNTADEHDNKIMDKMSKEEISQAMKDIRAQYGDNVTVQFPGDGMAALIESKKGAVNRELSEEEITAGEAKIAAFRNSIIQNERETLNHMPVYWGMYEDDKTIAAALENCTNEDKAFANPDSEWWFRRHLELRVPSNENRVKNNEKEQDDYDYFAQEYIKTAVSIMKQALEQFQSLFWGPDYQHGYDLKGELKIHEMCNNLKTILIKCVKMSDNNS